MTYVYILRSIHWPDKTYTGLTEDLKRRLLQHNQGKSMHTSSFKPWKLETYIAFSDHSKAEAFEKYLKHGSGWAFAKRHF
ncbi:excinuclease ABC subunit C [bacterium J17]|nr:excinuclease ABC subunit C [bacterium J17]